jgi:hypothetical protein
VNQVMTTADTGVRTSGNSWTDDAELWWNGNAEPQFGPTSPPRPRRSTQRLAKPTSVGSGHWLRRLRPNVTTTATGVNVFPSLCKVD